MRKTLIMLKLKAKLKMMNIPHPLGRNNLRRCHLWNNDSMFQTKQRYLTVLKTYLDARIYLIWPENLLMNACIFKLITDRREKQMLKLVTNHEVNYG